MPSPIPRLSTVVTYLQYLQPTACPRALSLASRIYALASTASTQPRRMIHYHISKPGEQATPLQGFYADMLAQPAHRTSSPVADEQRRPVRANTPAKGRIVFGSRLAGPTERREERERASRLVAGVRVPPRPQEPDNCCMSGCVNCVWDAYSDDLDRWVDATARAKARMLAAAGSRENDVVVERPTEEDLWKNIPVEIREFMKTEKRLRKQRALGEARA